MPYDNLVQPGDNPDITKERKTASFSLYKMQSFVYENEQILKRRKEIIDFIKSTPEFDDPVPPEFLDRDGLIDRAARLARAMTERMDFIDTSDQLGEGMHYMSTIMGRTIHMIFMHYAFFVQTIQSQSDEEQLEQWLEPAMRRAILGTYAQTELGHGTNLSKLETTATYDPKTEEFIIHTPNLTAAKWWPGTLGKTANYAVVMALLWTKGECKGPHPFLVQLRDENTHMPLRGLTIGDIGPKFGMNDNDNGFLLFDNFRIPRRNMFMRFSKVLPNGDYIAPKHAKLGFGTLIFTRLIVIKGAASSLGAAATIAIRYSAVRRQGEINEGAGEVQVLDYRTQQYRLLPQLARAFAFLFTAYEIKDMYMEYTQQLNRSGSVELLAELHALSTGLKSVTSWETAQGIEQCRLACGGHGYSQASAFPEIYQLAAGSCTLEGENIVMLLQTARFLMKAAKEIRAGGTNLAAIAEYIGRKDSGKARIKSWRHCSDEDIVHDFEHVARNQILHTYDRLKQYEATMTKGEAWNKVSIDLCKASRMHVRLYLAKNMLARIRTCEDPACRKVMHTLGKLYAFDVISGASGAFMKRDFMSTNQLERVQRDIGEMLEVLRPEVVALADSWDMTDRELRSVLGRRDGNVYPALLEWAKKSPLNKTEVLPTFDKHLGPMMREGRSHL